MDEITRGGAMYKHAWATLPKDRKRAISKAVQAGRVVTEETAIAVGYATRQIRVSWTGYAGVLALAVIINNAQGESFSGRALIIPAAVTLVAIYSYWRLFQARSRNEDLLFAQDDTLEDDDEDEDENGIAPIERLEDEGGPVSEVAVPPLSHPPTPPTPQAPSTPTPPPPPTPPAPPPAPAGVDEARTED